ncbi:MAG: hypothetical protein CM15mP80_06620 [Alphaproteobacteria bacterium]|nr:MAG: hypothetical protein CM15mP80_06620 [Alphaproteobacteria bacterium]
MEIALNNADLQLEQWSLKKIELLYAMQLQV